MITKIEETKLYKRLIEIDDSNTMASKITEVAKKCSTILDKINTTFPNFTLHDINHSIRIAEFMYDLLPNDVEQYNKTDISLLLYAAITHDIGMANFDLNPKTPTSIDKLRRDHHKKSKELILDHNIFEDSLFTIDEICIRDKIAEIAFSHNNSIEWIENNRLINNCNIGYDEVNLKFICYLLRLADLIDFDKQRTPLIIYQLLEDTFKTKQYSRSNDEWKKQLSINNYNHVKYYTDDNNEKWIKIVFDIQSNDSDICCLLFDYFEYIENEINDILKRNCKEKKYKLRIEPKVQFSFDKDNFDIQPLKQYIDYLSISNLLIGKNIYQDKRHALIELLQNSLDAVLLMKEISKYDYIPQISIIIDNDNFIIKDNGIGMTRQQIEKYFLCVGKSYYNSIDYNFKYKPISHYGIGFLSSYMLSDTVTVSTKSYTSNNQKLQLELKKNRTFVIFSETNDFSCHGTEIKMKYSDIRNIFNSPNEIIDYIKENFTDTEANIKIIVNGKEEIIKLEHIQNLYSTYLKNLYLECSVSSNQLKVKQISDFLSDEIFLYDSNIDPDQLIDKDFYKDLNECEGYYFNSIISHKDLIHSITINKLSDEQEELLDDITYHCSEEECVEKFSEEFSIFDEKIEIFVNENDFYTIPEEPVYFLSHRDNYFLADMKEKDFLLLVEEQLSRGKFLLEKNIKHIIYNNDYYSFIKTNRKAFRSSFFSRNNFFIKNVLIPNANILLPYIFSNLIISNLKINVLDNCIPNVARSDINENDSKEIGYAIGRAIHLDILNKGTISGRKLSYPEKELLELFINTYYSEKNKFCK